VWRTRIVNRTHGGDCPTCHPHGFNKSKPGWLYLFERPGELQVGVTGSVARRSQEHGLTGWELIDVVGPFDGEVAWNLEQALVAYVYTQVGALRGFREAWSTANLEVRTVRDLAAEAGIRLPETPNPA
jgi:hypothetical protein